MNQTTPTIFSRRRFLRDGTAAALAGAAAALLTSRETLAQSETPSQANVHYSGTHLTAPTRFIEVDVDKFAYRRWGNASSGQPPLLFVQHFRGGMDHWDPLLTDGLATGRSRSSLTRGLSSTRISGHGAHFQFPEEFAEAAARFLAAG